MDSWILTLKDGYDILVNEKKQVIKQQQVYSLSIIIDVQSNIY